MLFRKRSATPGFVGNALLAAEGLVLAVCDEASPFTRATICSEAWASTTPGSPDQLFEFNTYMQDQMSSGHAIVWILLLWGVFRLRVKLHDRVDQMPPLASSALLIGNGQESSINLRTGRLGWIDVENAARSGWRQIAVLPPGRYLGRLSGGENPDHWNLTSLRKYPRKDEDWVLHLAMLASDPSGESSDAETR